MAQWVKNLPAMPETQVLSLGGEDLQEEGMATHSSVLALENPMDRRARLATVLGVTKSQTWLWLTPSPLQPLVPELRSVTPTAASIGPWPPVNQPPPRTQSSHHWSLSRSVMSIPLSPHRHLVVKGPKCSCLHPFAWWSGQQSLPWLRIISSLNTEPQPCFTASSVHLLCQIHTGPSHWSLPSSTILFLLCKESEAQVDDLISNFPSP